MRSAVSPHDSRYFDVNSPGVTLLVKRISSFDYAQDGEPVEPYRAINGI
jgi:hypothetical protein